MTFLSKHWRGLKAKQSPPKQQKAVRIQTTRCNTSYLCYTISLHNQSFLLTCRILPFLWQLQVDFYRANLYSPLISLYSPCRNAYDLPWASKPQLEIHRDGSGWHISHPHSVLQWPHMEKTGEKITEQIPKTVLHMWASNTSIQLHFQPMLSTTIRCRSMSALLASASSPHCWAEPLDLGTDSQGGDSRHMALHLSVAAVRKTRLHVSSHYCSTSCRTTTQPGLNCDQLKDFNQTLQSGS